jgi:hypothetical protein
MSSSADPPAARPSAAAEIAALAGRRVTRMTAAFRAMYLGTPAAAPDPGTWIAPGLRGIGLLQLPQTLARQRDHETLFAFARCERFLQAQLDEFPRSRPGRPSADPVQTLDAAFRYARELDRVPEMAAFTLARARWGSRRRTWTPLAALQVGHEQLACELADSRPADQHAFWYLLLAWEYLDAGSRDGARRLLGRLLPMRLPGLGARAGRHIVVLLRHAAEISPEAFLDLQQRLLDDNDRTDLCRELIKAGQFALVPQVAATIRLFVRNRIPVLSDAAKAAAAAAQPEIAAAAIAQAADALRIIEADRADDADITESLAQIAGAQAALGDLGAARHSFTRAVQAWSRASRAAPALRTIAVELASASLFDDARLAISRIDDDHYAGEAREALALAQVRAGQPSAAVSTLGEIEPDLYLDYPRAIRNVACALAASGEPGLGADLARRRLQPDRHAGAVASAAIALAEAGDIAQAMTMADSVTEPGVHARALAGICRHPDGAKQAAEAARQAADELADPALRAELLAEIAASRAGEERDRLFGEARRLAGLLTGEERWHTLLAIGISQLRADPAGASGAFAETRQVIRDTEPDPMFWTDELWQVAMAQLRAGDAAGARQTLAEIPGEPATDPALWLKPVTLAGIAVSQAEAGQRKAARRACRLALRHAKGARGEGLAITCRAIAAAQAATGDLDGAAQTAAALLDIAETAADEGDEQAEAAAVEQALGAAVHVAREMTRAGHEKKARHLLSQAATRARGWLENSAFTYAEATGDLACALAELGKDGKAAKVAAWDQTGTATGRLRAVMAGRLARDGDLGGALATAQMIEDPRVQARAFRAIATALTSRGERTAARTVLTDGAAHLRAAPEVMLAAPALTEIAAAQADAGCADDLAATLELAVRAALDLDRADDKDYALSQIAQSWAVHGAPDRAMELAADIGNDDRAGEALITAALAMVARDRTAWPAAIAIIDGVTSPGWQAVGLAVAGAAAATGDGADTWTYFADVAPLLSRVPEGEPRARAQRAIIDVAMAAGHHQVALQVARAVTAGRVQILSELASDLAARGAADAVKSLLPDCAQQAESAYAACLALTRAVPGQADAIVTEVAAR